jgi:hypothetical protein
MRELYRSDYFVMTVDDALGLVRRTRTDRRFETLELVELQYEQVSRALDTLDRRRHVLVIDVRPAPPRNDPAYEQIFARYEERLLGGFRRIAFVAQTEVGRLQITRLLGPSPFAGRARVFMDDTTALAYLDSPEPSRQSGRLDRLF